MGKVLECATVDPSSGCKHVVRGNTEEEVLKNAMEHAKQHGIREATPELMAKVKGAMPRMDNQMTCLRPIRSPIGPPTKVPSAPAPRNKNR